MGVFMLFQRGLLMLDHPEGPRKGGRVGWGHLHPRGPVANDLLLGM